MNQESRGKTPLWLAVKYDHADVVRYLLGQGCNDDRSRLLGDAVRLPSVSILQMLLEMGTDPKLKNDLAQNGLHTAASVGREDAIPFLLTYGIDINHRYQRYQRSLSNRFGRSPLQTARARNHQAFVQVLLENGALDETSEPKKPSTPTPATPTTPPNSLPPIVDSENQKETYIQSISKLLEGCRERRGVRFKE